MNTDGRNNKVIIFSAPSGSGKTTIIKRLLTYFPEFEFSISATSRQARAGEVDGQDYYFLTKELFDEKVKNDLFLEWEEVYAGTCYGTLKSEIERIWGNGKIVVFDVDVLGGMRLKEYFGSKALSIFVMPPSIEVLEQRLRIRNTETEEAIQKRLSRSSLELQHSTKFDLTVVNDVLEQAVDEAKINIQLFLNQ
ncbi:MAG: guanylate kinase [Bacteroidales bacterium]|nr:guanylate kinase [Bacteroidales bacterium]MBR7167714.1 guanylate kinase [Bacteroidales bacterium]